MSGKNKHHPSVLQEQCKSHKQARRSAKSLQATPLCYFNVKSTPLIPLTFIKLERTKHGNSNFLHPLSFSLFLFAMHNSKSVLCMRIQKIPKKNALLMEIIPTCLELRVSYDWRVVASKLSPRCFTFLFGHIFGFSGNNCVCEACVRYTGIDEFTN